MTFDLTFYFHGQIQGESTDIVPKLSHYVYQKVLKWRLASLGSLHNTTMLSSQHGCDLNEHGLSVTMLDIVWDHFCTPAYVISGRYAVPRPLILSLTWKANCQVTGHRCVSCSGRLVIVWDHFATRPDVISGRYPVAHALTLNLTLEIKCQIKGLKI